MAEKTVSYLGGTIGFESAEFKGSTFWFSIDLDKTSSEARKDEVLLPAQLPVLLVEDNKINQKIAFFTLKKLGFPVEIAENGLEAVERFQNDEFKIVLMDLQMPIMNGFDATSKIRAFEKFKERKSSLIVALSANTIKEDIEKCFVVGMNEYISKPFSPEKLIEVIRKHIEIQL
jgi:CheY-like chemotaxis protein